MVLGKLPVPGRPTVWIIVGQGPTALAGGADGGCLDIFSLVYHFCFLTPSLWETARYRLKYCLKGPLSPNQPTNISAILFWAPLTKLMVALNPWMVSAHICTLLFIIGLSRRYLSSSMSLVRAFLELEASSFCGEN